MPSQIHTHPHGCNAHPHTYNARHHTQWTPSYTMHTRIHSHILTYTLTHPNHPHITHLHIPHIHPHTQSHIPTHPHTPPHATHTDWWSSIERGRSTGDRSWPPPPWWSVVFLSVSLCLCHSVCLSVCLSGIVSALHLYSGGSSSAGSCSGGVAGIMSAVATFQQSTPCWRWPTTVWMEGQKQSRLFAGREWSFCWAFGRCSNRLLQLPLPLPHPILREGGYI